MKGPPQIIYSLLHKFLVKKVKQECTTWNLLKGFYKSSVKIQNDSTEMEILPGNQFQSHNQIEIKRSLSYTVLCTFFFFTGSLFKEQCQGCQVAILQTISSKKYIKLSIFIFLSRRLHDIDQTSSMRFLSFLYKYSRRFFWFDQIWLDHPQNDKIGDVFWFILVLMKEFFHQRKRTSIVH